MIVNKSILYSRKCMLWKNIFLKYQREEWHYFFTFEQISLMCSIMEDSWILISAPAFSLLQYVVLVEVNEENLASLKYVVRKGRVF